ncbi:histidine kinase [Tenacibaculum sp. MAR_2009_124]|uniref:tetratricopeptide repeat-containing sensor histidine kinase n=1 Tax=Tenacibaculum sp. MAR_2009_124 TaxID=1250059 RepID=UPI0015A23828|nr:histidine kinase [Tenacibaculum sp. MAR_2009_124]
MFSQNDIFEKADSLRKASGLKKRYLNELKRISKILDAERNNTGILKLHIRLLEYYKQGDYKEDSIVKYFKKGKLLSREYENKSYDLNFDYMWGDHLVSKGNYTEALIEFQKLEKILNEKEHEFLPNFYDAYARLLYFLGDYGKSFSMLKKEAKIFEKRDKYENICAVYNNLGILYKARKQKDSALHYHRKTQKLNLKHKDTLGVIMSYNNIGLTYYENNDLFNAEKYFIKAFNYAPGRVTKSLLSNYAKILLLRRDYVNAEKFLIEVKENAETKRLLKDALTQLVTLNKVQKKYKEASAYQDELSLVTAQLLDEIKIKEIKKLQVVHETERKEHQILALQEKNRTQETIIEKNKLIAVIFLIVLLLILVVFLMYLRNKINVDKLNRIQLQQRLLRSQMNPHFIFNALSNIQANILKRENDKAVKYLGKFAKLLRYNLENTNLNKALFSSEIQSLIDYLEMQKLRLNNNLDYEVDIDDNLEQDFTKIPAMIIQPIIENAIEHGVEGVDKPRISLKIEDLDDKIECVIKDNGIGYSISLKKKKQKKESYATSIIKKRLDLLSKKTKLSFRFTIEDIIEKEKIQGTKVVITLPIFNVE